MLLGTLPIWFSITPVCFSSGLLLKSDESPNWVALGNTMVLVASCVQGGAALGAALCIQRTSKKYFDELGAIEDDEEVKSLEMKDIEALEIFELVTNWHTTKGPNRFPLVMKLITFTGLMLMSVSMYAFLLFPEQCFETFTISDSIDEKLGGRMTNVVKKDGWIVIALFCAACGCKLTFTVWASWRVRQYHRLSSLQEVTQTGGEGTDVLPKENFIKKEKRKRKDQVKKQDGKGEKSPKARAKRSPTKAVVSQTKNNNRTVV
jgi:hypothetical protein